MKYIFIAGLEHSGTTLTDYLFSQTPNALGLGEVSQYFSPSHMQQYFDRWGTESDVDLCSCQQVWSDCDFWGEIVHLNGRHSTASVVDKYQGLFDYIKQKYGSEIRVIDSSKTVEAFKGLEPLIQKNSILTDVNIVFTCKDVRSFAMSIIRKKNKGSLYEIYQSFNWWISANQTWLEFLESANYEYTINLYENLCQSPDYIVNQVMGGSKKGQNLGLSHIAMGNKNFTVRKKEQISYDGEWRSNWKIKLVYFLHRRARKFNTKLYQLALKE